MKSDEVPSVCTAAFLDSEHECTKFDAQPNQVTFLSKCFAGLGSFCPLKPPSQ